MIGFPLNSHHMLVPWSDFSKELCLIFGGRCNGASWDGWQSWGLLLKLCHFFPALFFGFQITWVTPTGGIQFLHVETSGRLLHRQRKEAAGFEPVKKSTNVTLFLGKNIRILLALVACQSFIVLVDRMISHFHSFSDLLLKLLTSCRWWFPCGGSVCKSLF